ncbi:Late embryogenesis abundant protein [Parasponia andersonii]|uniref:Late embryogenesis abundant protein n=1 Tax=Parasponia andersonii TaxID=3476 RepID=A0A2P5C6R7_PARAD|nr:Late embryogenesis abundant protein [Parasponia andersonii]
MQAVKEKLTDMKEMRKARAEAKAEEKEEKEMAKARMEVAHEVRLAKEADAARQMHLNKAGEAVKNEIAKHSPEMQ